MQSGNINSINKSNLFALANMCPFVDGIIVYEARNLYNSLVKTPLLFKDACNNPLVLKNAQVKNREPLSFKVYPNPSSSGNFKIVMINNDDSTQKNVQVINMFGKTVLQKQVFNSKSLNFELKHVPDVYIIIIFDSKGKRSTKKIVIN